jgi:hypothetical protein
MALSASTPPMDRAPSSDPAPVTMSTRPLAGVYTPTLWESVIPECLMGLPGDPAEIDALGRGALTCANHRLDHNFVAPKWLPSNYSPRSHHLRRWSDLVSEQGG